MGIFDQDNYAPVGNESWLDGILRSVGVQPSAGFPTSPMDAQASAPAPQPAAPQNAPMPIGDYQMPRIGNFPGYPEHNPQTGETMPAPAPQPAAPNPLLRAAAALHSIAGGGSLYGAATGNFDDAKSTKLRELQAQHKSYLGMGATPQQAQFMVLNPEAGKAFVTQKFGPNTVQSLGEGWVYNPKTGKTERAYTPEQKDNFGIVQTNENGMGGKTFQKMNKATGDITPIASASGADAGGGGLGDMTKTGAEYLATLPPDVAGRVKAMVEGRQPPPGGLARGRPYWQNLMTAAQTFDPTFDETNWSGRVAGVKDFSAGKSSEMVRSANQTLHHVGSLLDSMDALKNGSYPLFNKIGNAASEATGSGAQGSFRTNAHAVAEELSKVFKGSNLSDAEIHAWEANLHENMSPEQQQTQVAKLKELLTGSLHALDEKRVASIGQVAADKAGPIIKPEGVKVLERIDQWTKSNGAGAAGALPAGWSVKVN